MNERHERTPRDDDIATLIRLAGKRQAVPRERHERIKAMARAEWQQEIRNQPRKRILWPAAALAAAAMLVVAIALKVGWVGTDPTTTAGPGPGIPVEALDGVAWTFETDSAEPRALAVGDGVGPGSELETAEGSRAAIRLASGHSIRLDASSAIRLLGDSGLALDRGAVYIDSGPGNPEGVLDVHTPLGVIQELGTQYEVRLQRDDSLRVSLREGAVMVRHGDDSHRVDAGTELALSPDGTVTRRPVSPHDPAWRWAADVAPTLDLEGITARAFLDWVARERGWTLMFADAEVARASEETVLTGAVGGLGLEDALDTVLPTCRMTYRVEDGALVISSDR